MQFPLFAKHASGQVWYMIASESSFKELRILGSKVMCSDVKADDYPTRVYIHDLLQSVESGGLEIVTAIEFEAIERKGH